MPITIPDFIGVSQDELISSQGSLTNDTRPASCSREAKYVTAPSFPIHSLRMAWLAEASMYEKLGFKSKALDLLYDNLDEMMLRGDFEVIDQLLGRVRLEGLSTDLLIGFLSVTLAGSDKLKCRSEFLRNAERILRDRGDWAPGVLDGL